ncbi:MAG: glycosyltransferase family 4 protein [Ruminococcaceae bacterium]|nr:glycosyltransferase family 4 protein [Oscillospiraceae bacterium]
MNILFVADKINSKGDPIINLANNLEKCLEKDHKIFYLGYDPEKSNANDFCFYYPWDDKVREIYFGLNGKSALGKLGLLLSHPFLSFLGVFKVFNIDLISHFYKKQIEFVCKKYNIDAAVSLSAPFYTAKGLAKAKIKAKKIIMMFDPYAKHYIFKNSRTEKMEQAAFAAAHHIFVPALLKPHYPQDNVSSVEFPCMIVDDVPAYSTPLLDKTKTNILFCGSLYSDIRSPEYLYELVKKSQNPDLHITIVGGVYGKFSDEFNAKYADFIKEKVTLVGRVDKDTARRYISEADILVNIGNTVDNMLPSKVLECVSSGKRVLNLCQIENCPSLPYFEKYGNSLALYTKKEIDSTDIEKFSSFVASDKQVSKEEILHKFADATPQYVAQQLIDAINL